MITVIIISLVIFLCTAFFIRYWVVKDSCLNHIGGEREDFHQELQRHQYTMGDLPEGQGNQYNIQKEDDEYTLPLNHQESSHHRPPSHYGPLPHHMLPHHGSLPHHMLPHHAPAPHRELPPLQTGKDPQHYESIYCRNEDKKWHFNSSKAAMILLILFVEVICAAPFVILNLKVLSTAVVFLVTIIIIFLRPGSLNEAYPAGIGASIILLTGIVSYPNLLDITEKIGGASVTILATIVMAVVLESFGFFYWVATGLAKLSKGSGYRLFWYIQLLCFLMTLLFNNDGSILITTPILILLLRNLHLKPHEKIPYLLSGALIATASSAPIGVSNIVNLISLSIVHISLYEHTSMMFVPATIGLLFMSALLFLMLKKRCLRTLPEPDIEWEDAFFIEKFHSIRGKISFDEKHSRTGFMLKILAFVFGIRCSLFIASYLGIPIAIVAVLGSVVLLVLRWYYFRTNLKDVLQKTPWHILLFAFSMYVIIYGLHNIGLTEQLIKLCKPIVSQSLFHANFMMGGLISILSNIFNNHPALMVGTITLQNMELSTITMKMIYLANIIGSDMGSLLLPIGTLASLLWMHILKQSHIKVSWRDYISVTIVVIPLTVVFTLSVLYCWMQLMFA